ncbi:ATP-grasp domain-containing protein [Streptomyces sp. NPDC001840]
MSAARGTPRLAVAYDLGAVTVAEISASLSQFASLVFVSREASEHTRPLLALLRDIGEVVEINSDAMDGIDRAVSRLSALGCAGIVTFSERMLPLTSELARRLGLPGHSPDTLRLLTDKFSQRERLRAAGVDQVRSTLLDDAGQWPKAVRRIGLPAVVKPVRGEGSRDTHRVDDAIEGHRLIVRLLKMQAAPLVVEEFLQGRPAHPFGDYVSVESVTSGGETTPIAVTGKLPLVEPFRETGQFWPARLTDGDRRNILDLTRKAVSALGVMTGLTHTEIKLTDDGPRIIEVNGRLGGTVSDLALRGTGLDLIELAGREALGKPLNFHYAEPEHVVFQCWNLAPSRPCRLQSVEGADKVRALPGITGYQALVRPGTLIDSGVSTRELNMIRGETNDHTELIALVNRARGCLTFTFTPADPHPALRGDDGYTP